jgi:hypothetical protein
MSRHFIHEGPARSMLELIERQDRPYDDELWPKAERLIEQGQFTEQPDEPSDSGNDGNSDDDS